MVGVIGGCGVGKSSIMNQLYGFNGSSTAMLPPFPILSEETKAMARHSTSGIEPRISPQRLLLLDTQPVFSASVLADLLRPDSSSSSSVSMLTPDSSSTPDLAHHVMAIQVVLSLIVIFFFNVC